MDLAPQLTPSGALRLGPSDVDLDPAIAARIQRAFSRGAGHGLLHLGAAEPSTALPPDLAWWRDLARRYVVGLCSLAEAAEPTVPSPTEAELTALVRAAPLMTGAEHLDPDVLADLWCEFDAALQAELAEAGQPLQAFLASRHPAWHLVGRVHLNLADNRKGSSDGPDAAETPFAFMATYTTRLTAQARAQHAPLGRVLREYAGEARRDELLRVLRPVQQAAEACPWLRKMVDSGEIYYPLRWTPAQALQLLRDVPALEAAGVIVRMPASWRRGRPARPKVSARVGQRPASGLGLDALLDFQAEVVLDGQRLTAAEIKALLAQSSGLVLVRGEWVELDRERLQATLTRFQEIERLAREHGLSFAEATRLLTGARPGADDAAASRDWSDVVAGDWLAATLRDLRDPQGLAQVDPGPELQASLRTYQQHGVRWLHLLSTLGLGACLADDMGLGKTMQVISLLLVRRRSAQRGPSLLVVPASLIGNWTAELDRFAPSLRYLVAHPSALPAADLKARPPKALVGADLVITTYGTLLRAAWLTSAAWDLAILDEAQAIKNPGARQTLAAKQLTARARIAMTGTPVENRPTDLWSIFDYINPGLLGTAKEFTAWIRSRSDAPTAAWGPLRELVRPYILRRLKTDRSIIADLPDKTELRAWCTLSKPQVALYQTAVDELAATLRDADGMKRRGAVLSFLMRFKQICNHPSQWLADGAWSEADSGKWERLRDIVEVIAARQEKVLVFTQFRELCDPLAAFLTQLFGRPGLVLHGETAVARRKQLVDRFQTDDRVPFFVLSLKAGGAGLNLTAASHVVHFDRWWNPAVENQATDRAYRIGQKRNVLVHKFVCRGTVEERIEALIESKRQLSDDLLEGGAEVALTELPDDELLRLVALDLRAATAEG
jgi:superfamily II DNA or RNA helicase